MLKIQVLGKGLIPRGYGIAPKKTPFPADLTLIGIILSTPGLKVNFLNPETNVFSPLTRENYQRTYKKYENYRRNNPPAINTTEVKNDESKSSAKIEASDNKIVINDTIGIKDSIDEKVVNAEKEEVTTVDNKDKTEEKNDDFSMEPIQNNKKYNNNNQQKKYKKN